MSNSAISGPIFTDVRRSPSGSAAAPSWSFADATGTGVYLASTDVLALSTAGVQRVVVDAGGAVLIGGQTSPSSNNIRLMVQGRSGGNNGGIELLTDGGGGGALFSNNGAGMQFYTFTGAAGSELFTERMRIDASGNLLVGTTSSSTTAAGFRVTAGGGGAGDVVLSANRPASTNLDAQLLVFSTGAGVFRFYVGMGGTIYATNTTITSLSDQRLKENVRDLDDGLASVMALKPRKFDWKEGKGKNVKDDRGFIAQEFEEVFPDLIDTWRDPAPEGEEPYKAVNANLIPTLVKAIQEQQEIIGKLEARLAALESK